MKNENENHIIEKFMNEFGDQGDAELIAYLYISEKNLKKQLDFWKKNLMASNYKVHILFYDGEENGDILHKKVLKETIFQCINFSRIPLFVRNYNTISQNKLEARVFKYMLLKYAGIEIVAMEEQKKSFLICILWKYVKAVCLLHMICI